MEVKGAMLLGFQLITQSSMVLLTENGHWVYITTFVHVLATKWN